MTASVTAPVLGDALGPRGRRQARIATVVAAAVIVGLAVLLAVRRLQDKGQFDRRPVGARSPLAVHGGSS